MLHLHEGPELRTHFWWDREEKKAQYPAGFDLSAMRRALYLCATATALDWCKLPRNLAQRYHRWQTASFCKHRCLFLMLRQFSAAVKIGGKFGWQIFVKFCKGKKKFWNAKQFSISGKKWHPDFGSNVQFRLVLLLFCCWRPASSIIGANYTRKCHVMA